MTRSERLLLEGKAETEYLGVLKLMNRPEAIQKGFSYEETDLLYNVDVYSLDGTYVAVINKEVN